MEFHGTIYFFTHVASVLTFDFLLILFLSNTIFINDVMSYIYAQLSIYCTEFGEKTLDISEMLPDFQQSPI